MVDWAQMIKKKHFFINLAIHIKIYLNSYTYEFMHNTRDVYTSIYVPDNTNF